MEDFKFIEETHQYFLNGIEIPSVSAVIQSMSLADYSMIDQALLKSAQEFGKNAHLMAKFADSGTLDIVNLDIKLFPYLNGYMKFKSQYKPNFILGHMELPSYSKQWQYGYTTDRAAIINDKITIYDLKFSTTVNEDAGSIQLAGYQVGFEEKEEKKVEQRWLVQILPDNFKIYPCEDKTDRSAFLGGLAVYKWKNKRGING